MPVAVEGRNELPEIAAGMIGSGEVLERRADRLHTADPRCRQFRLETAPRIDRRYRDIDGHADEQGQRDQGDHSPA
ncbi:MAG TPA: hypothetical protein VHE36_14680 [Sphingomicrobium sp.]|nr:hypothetical protein [Sphingomicrobium sp.]